ncbi:hypothetical protein RIF29_23302 [Crotalaria pallida]|uniref:Transcription repressor n=1 Tax=Crotalaria pallida TaxID=3830 RepID=A0AAN9I8I9_CROPI
MGSTINLKHFKLCFPKSKFTPPPESSESTNTTTLATSSHHDHDHNHPCPTTTTSSPLIKNFNSLYEPEPDDDDDEEPAADLATALASQRFFFSSPGHSNSLIEYNKTNNTHHHHHHQCITTQQHYSSSSLVDGDGDEKNKKKKKNKVLVFNGSVAVPTYSPDPYLDFRRSMQEMVEARPELMDVNSNWNVLHQLLLSYLALNPKATHNFILSAFSDLLISLMDVTV